MDKKIRNISIAECVEEHLEFYFKELGDAPASGVYDMVINQVEAPIIEMILLRCNGNQTKAAKILGLNRNTLRKKMVQHNLCDLTKN